MNTAKIWTIISMTSIVLTINSCQQTMPGNKEFAHQFIESYQRHRSISYDIDYQIKFFSQTADTTKLRAAVQLIRQDSDSIFGAYIWITADSITRYYNTEAFYLINHVTHTITQYPKDKASPLTGNIVGDVYPTYFINPDRILRAIEDTTTVVQLQKDSVNEIAMLKMNIDILDDDQISNSWKNVWFDPHNLSIKKMNYHVEMQGETQYNQWDLHNIVFDKSSVETLEAKLADYLKQYKLEQYKAPQNRHKTMANGSKLPDIKSLHYTSADSVYFYDYLNKLTLYDFWYIDCPPCIEAIPHLNALHQKYKDKGLTVVGVNPINNNEKDRQRLPNFLKHNPIDYPWLFIDKQQAEQLKVSAYPTFYLVDQNGSILHSEIGFSAEKVAEFDAQIGQFLNQ